MFKSILRSHFSLRTAAVLMVVVSLQIIASPQAENADAKTLTRSKSEVEYVRILRDHRLQNTHTSDEVLKSLSVLSGLCQRKQIRLPETYAELTQYLETYVYREHISTQTELDTHPAMLALYYGGETAVPYVEQVILDEEQGSRSWTLALWTLIYIYNADFRLTYAQLNEASRHAKSQQSQLKLLGAAMKAYSYDPETVN